MTRRIAALMMLFAITGWSGVANSLIIGTLDTVPGTPNYGGSWPFGESSGWPAVYQQIYKSSAFSSLGTEVSISSLSFYQGGTDSDKLGPNKGTYSLTLSTTATSVDDLSTQPSENQGSIIQQVFSGKLPGAPGFGGQWDLNFNVSNFLYKPEDGNLLLTITADALDRQDNWLVLQTIDSDEYPNDSTSRLFGATSGTSSDGNLDSDGLVTGFNEASVPEPATLAMFGLGLAGLGFSRRRKV